MERSNSKANDGVSFEVLKIAIRASWCLETCDPTDAADWAPTNPSLGQCAVTALVVHDFFGGELLEAEVFLQNGSRQGFHYWNRLASVDVDLTREQFKCQEVVREPQVIDRLPEFPWQAEQQYRVLRDRVNAALAERLRD
jgi:hypothetical protein